MSKLFSNNFKEIYGHIKELNDIDENDYYDSWKLRGDSPTLYKYFKFDSSKILDFWSRSGVSKRLNSDDASYTSVKSAMLYGKYHYDYEVKEKGRNMTEFRIPKGYIKVIEEIQKNMRMDISKKNIAIESNPSSNYLISSFKRYSEHPILKFNNLGLTYHHEEVINNPQIFVSINTDDQGVFGTYLENEYALMALALEKETDEDGNRKYSQTMIYDWLDKIRQMGLEQSFKNLSDL